MKGYSDEFPLLEGVGLYASDISGDGDCLFHALSDQLYGHENNHAEIREKVVEYMRVHAEYFKLFLDVGPTRRAPRRKGAAGANQPIVGPTEDAIDKAFAQHLKRMSQSGVYGDNMEISAFARDYNCDVKIYQRDFAYVVTGGEGASGLKSIMHIAYHTWEHYSSVRNRGGPHTGPPKVTPTPLTEGANKLQEQRLASTSYVLPWMEGVVASSLPYLADMVKIRQTLEECKGNIDEAVSRLLDVEEESLGKVAETGNVSRAPSPSVTNRRVETETEVKEDKTTARQTRALARAKAKEGKLKNAGSDNGSEKSVPVTEEPRKQPAQRPKRETAREKKMKQKEAAKARKRDKNAGKKDEESENDAAIITSGIRELYI